MSAPNVAGSLGLLGQHAENLYGAPLLASTVKALVIHTAGESGAAPGPDYRYGWGLMNTAAAADLMTKDSLAESVGHIYEFTIAEGASEVLSFFSEGTLPIRATISWTDPPGPVPAGFPLDPPDTRVVNDIDLRVIDPAAASHEPWVMDPADPSAPAARGDNVRDTVEQVYIEYPQPGAYALEISHKSFLYGDSASRESRGNRECGR